MMGSDIDFNLSNKKKFCYDLTGRNSDHRMIQAILSSNTKLEIYILMVKKKQRYLIAEVFDKNKDERLNTDINENIRHSF